ncbi:Coatomer subunit beta' [Geranomyces michiganensis]|nr:Coatomer subunit beta' [Geranomyces michiganensis]
MPLRLDIKRKLSNRSDRVKAVDFHPTEPWLLAALYNGTVYIWNHETQNVVKTFEVTDLPVRAAKFVARKSWLITGSDDMQVKVFNYNTHEKLVAFEAHQDYIRNIAVHPTQPYILTCSDDMMIKLWDWEKGWKNINVFEGHTHYIMQVTFNPKDGNTFASACLDRTVKVWSLGSSTPNYTLEGHEKGVNSVDYYHGGDKPYLITGADDKTIKVWDYQNKTCVQTLEGHTHNVTAAAFHPELPIIISASEDGTVRLWHANTYRLENTLNYGMERAWTLAYLKGSNDVAFGYDEGTVAVKLGREEPAISMDSGGKIIWARHNEIQTANVKANIDENVKDGERMTLSTKELGSCEVYPQTLQHSPNGRFVVVCGDGEYIIYTALAWRNKSFGSALEFVWALDSNEYAIRESSSKVKLFKNFKEKTDVIIRPSYSAEGIFGGALLGIRSSNFLNFYDWDTGVCVRRVDVVARNVYWSESDLVAIVCDDITYVLRFNRVSYQQYVDRHGVSSITEEGIEEAVEFVTEINECIKTGCWVGDSFIYTNAGNRLNYLVGGQTSTLSHFDTNLYLLGYIPRDNRVYLADKDLSVLSYALPLSLIQYQTAVLRGDLVLADSLLPSVPADQRNRVARFLEGQNLKEQALAVSADPEHRFDLAIQLQRMDLAYEIAQTLEQEEKWKVVGDKALELWQFDLADECLRNAKDLEGLLLLYQAGGNREGLATLAEMAVEKGKNNIAFLCHLLRGEVEKCTELLVSTDRIPEAALLARTYMPSQVPALVDLWRADLVKKGKPKVAESIAAPEGNEEAFPDMEYGLFAEEAFKRQRDKGPVPAEEYRDMKDSLDWDVVGQLKERFPNGPPEPGTSSRESREERHRVRLDVQEGSAARGDEETQSLISESRSEAIEDNLSHLSLDVNTTGTGSARGDIDSDDLAEVQSTDEDRNTGDPSR